MTLHIAFDTASRTCSRRRTRLRAQGVTPLSFFGAETDEPDVLAWMPAAAVYFEDPDGHLLEYLAMLDEEPRPEAGHRALLGVGRGEPAAEPPARGRTRFRAAAR